VRDDCCGFEARTEKRVANGNEPEEVRKMNKRLLLVVALIAALSLVAAPVSAGAEKPISGEMELYFNLGFGNSSAPCPDITWAGTVELEGTTYGMAFFPTGEKNVGQVHHFTEVWKIYDTPFTFVGGVLAECASGDVVLSGTDAGVSSPNSKYRMNGTVGEAFAPFVQWDGRNVHMSGDITWAEIVIDEETIIVPATAPGYFRIN
jgi:hypothetical protein